MTKWLDCEKEPPTKDGKIVVLIGENVFLAKVCDIYSTAFERIPKGEIAYLTSEMLTPQWVYPSHFKHPEKYCYLPEIEEKE